MYFMVASVHMESGGIGARGQVSWRFPLFESLRECSEKSC